jgi:hypothetical protein
MTSTSKSQHVVTSPEIRYLLQLANCTYCVIVYLEFLPVIIDNNDV